MVGYRQTNQKTDTGKTLTRWPVFVDHFKLELANLMTELASVKMEVITTQALLFDAEQKNKQLEEQLKDKQAFMFQNGIWWKEGDKIAFCPKCYESENIKFHMEAREKVVGMMGSYDYKHWHCRRCNSDFDRI
ncbi:hypothetical protein [Klebsiella pneumoniae]|uniref:hypothetical protein n=1 Tax=Klebsiella pneumoniae TaxID=573 RepID=UPI001D0E3980|nr:hypothetical protein [Klebsiella pneumoniae]